MRVRLWIFLFCLCGATVMADEQLIIDDRSSGTLESALGSSWRVFTDTVVTALERIGVVAIGRVFTADLCIGRVGFYSGTSD